MNSRLDFVAIIKAGNREICCRLRIFILLIALQTLQCVSFAYFAIPSKKRVVELRIWNNKE